MTVWRWVMCQLAAWQQCEFWSRHRLSRRRTGHSVPMSGTIQTSRSAVFTLRSTATLYLASTSRRPWEPLDARDCMATRLGGSISTNSPTSVSLLLTYSAYSTGFIVGLVDGWRWRPIQGHIVYSRNLISNERREISQSKLGVLWIMMTRSHARVTKVVGLRSRLVEGQICQWVSAAGGGTDVNAWGSSWASRSVLLQTNVLWWWHTVKKLAQETCTSFVRKFLASNFRASSCKFGWRHIK